MKRSAQILMVLSLALAAQSAVSGDGHVPFPNDPRDRTEPNVNVAQSASTVRDAGVDAEPARHVEDILEAMGFAGRSPFPSRGGQIDE